MCPQYKDAFFSANPDFKWYKLPAPPLRTLSSRPRETDKPAGSPNSEHHDEMEKTNNNSTKVDFNKKSKDESYEAESKPLSMFTPGKLADEAQMGGLSSLLATKTETQTTNPYYSPPGFKFNAISTPNENRSHNLIERPKAKGPRNEESIRELQNALTETSRLFEEDFDDDKKRIYYGTPNDQFTNQDVIDQIVDKRYSAKEDEYGYQRNYSDDEKNMRSGRSCKGKRYQEFMAVGGLIVNKRQKRDSDKPDENYSGACSWDSGSREDAVEDEPKYHNSTHEKPADSDDKPEPADTPEPDNNGNKTFKAADFDLDAKIRALPSLSLEKFQQKKRDNKRKKKTVNLKPKAPEPAPIVNSVPRSMLEERRQMAEKWREQVSGSQKRKPRKVSITRFEVSARVTEDIDEDDLGPEIMIATEAPRAALHTMELCHQSQQNVDLMALATLAEVASHTSKLDDSCVIQNMTAKASDPHASMV